MLLAQVKDVVAMPEAAVVFEGDSTFVYFRTDSVPKPVYARRAVATGLSNGIMIEVKKGVGKTDVIRGNKIE